MKRSRSKAFEGRGLASPSTRRARRAGSTMKGPKRNVFGGPESMVWKCEAMITSEFWAEGEARFWREIWVAKRNAERKLHAERSNEKK
jgi:hypothetical protein